MQMQMQSNGNGNGNYKLDYKYTQFCNDNYYEEEENDIGFYNHNNHPSNGSKEKKSRTKILPLSSPCTSTSPLPSSTVSISSGGGGGGGGSALGFIEHPVSRLDTLAGIAIKYGVEVADIKKMNGLVTDLQMFALKTLQIPLPGRHPPSPCLSNGSDIPGQNNSEQTPSHRHSDIFDSFQSLKLNSSQRKVSPAMSSLQGYYGLKPIDRKITEGFEMAVYRKGTSHYLEDVQYLNPSPSSNPPLSGHRKSRSLLNGYHNEINGEKFLLGEAREGDSEKLNEKLFRRRQKSEADFTSSYPEMLMREDNSSGGAFSAIKGKGLALRSKAASRTVLPTDAEAGGLTPIPIGPGDSLIADVLPVVRKSSSTSSLQDQDGSNSSIWSTSKWNLKPDLQVLSAAAITRPIFDGLPKPISGRKNKAALD